MQIIHYCDPAHGWMKVRRSLLIKLGLQGMISSYSYERKDSVYLEEDCDAGLLFDRLDNLGIKWSIKTMHSDKTSKIRGYANYRCLNN